MYIHPFTYTLALFVLGPELHTYIINTLKSENIDSILEVTVDVCMD